MYFNLAARDWILKYHKDLLKLLPDIEGVVGNVEEAAAFSLGLGIPVRCSSLDSAA